MSPKVCLNMIVKNEAHVIAKTLANVLDNVPISEYVISDTGSTDGTQTIIRELFAARNIPGHVTQDEWRDFAHNRSLAIRHAQTLSRCEYLFMFDADDVIHGNMPNIFTSKLFDSYSFVFGNDTVYSRPLLIRASLAWRFRGVLHEFLHLDGQFSQTTIRGAYYVESGRTGARNKDPRKYINDALVFERAICDIEATGVDADLLNRYYFYLAQSYRDANISNKNVPIDHSIKNYKKVLTLTSWDQEKYISCMRLGEMYESVHEVDTALFFFHESTKYDPNRIEGVVNACRILVKQARFQEAYELFFKHRLYQKPDAKQCLFFDINQYHGILELIGGIASYYVDDKFQAFRCFKHVMDNPDADPRHKGTAVANLLFLRQHIEQQTKRTKSLLSQLMDTVYLVFHNMSAKRNIIPLKMQAAWSMLEELYVEGLGRPVAFEPKLSVKRKQHPKIVCTVTTCKRYDLFLKTMRSLFHTWNDAHLVDEWIIVDDNSSAEDRALMRKEFKWFRFLFKTPEDRGHRSSMNIIFKELERLRPKYCIHLEDDFLFHRKLNYVQDAVKTIETLKPSHNVR